MSQGACTETENDLFDTIARYYDLIYAHRTDDVDLWLHLSQGVEGELLALGCGTGRLLLPLLQEGHRVTGIDLSAIALQAAQAKVDASGFSQQARLQQADMRRLNLAQKDFAFAFIPSNTFMHCLIQADQRTTLKSAKAHLRSGGTLVVDLYHPHPQNLLEADARLELMHQAVDELTGHLVQQFCVRQIDLAQQLQFVTFILDEIRPDGSVHRQTIPFTMRYVHRFEMELLLNQAGFQVVDILGDYEPFSFTEDSPRMIFVAERI